MAGSFKSGVHSFTIQPPPYPTPLCCRYIKIYWDFCPIVISLMLIHYQSNYLFADMWVCCVFPEQPSLQSGSPLCVLPPMIRLLPFLRLSLTRQKATWGMTGPTWLTWALLASAVLFSCVENCWQLINGWLSSVGYFFVCFFHKGQTGMFSPDWVELRCC